MNMVNGSHSIGQNLYHLEWCPKNRYKMYMKEENKKLCEDILGEVAERHKIKEFSVMSDHIHAIVGIPPTMSVSQDFHLLKGVSSRGLFKQKPNFRMRYPRGHFWSPGKFYRSVDDADTETVMHYVRN